MILCTNIRFFCFFHHIRSVFHKIDVGQRKSQSVNFLYILNANAVIVVKQRIAP